MGVFIRNLVEKDDFPAEDEQKDSEMLFHASYRKFADFREHSLYQVQGSDRAVGASRLSATKPMRLFQQSVGSHLVA
jgi:hypothetical protein